MFKKIKSFFIILTAVLMLSLVITPTTANAATSYPAAKTLPTLTGNKMTDVVAVAESQVGYTPTTANVTVYHANLNKTQGIAWCGIFAKWVMVKAGVTDYTNTGYASTTSTLKWFQNKGWWHGCFNCSWSYGGVSGTNTTDSSYTPKPGDIMLQERNSNKSDGPDHTSIVVAVTSTTVTTVEGNYGSGSLTYVGTRTFTKGTSAWNTIWGYGHLSSLGTTTVTSHSTCIWNNGTVTEAATCGSDGVKTYTCIYSGCGKTKKEAIPATGKHTYVHNCCSVCGMYQSLDIPALTSVANTVKGVRINWNSVSGAERYRIYRRVPGGTWSRIGESSSNGYTDTTAQSGVTYYYTVRCVTYDSKRLLSSCDSTGIKAIFLSPVAQKTPVNYSGGIQISWKQTAGAHGYCIYRKTSGGSYTRIATVSGGTTLYYNDTSVKNNNGVTYIYAVRAYYGSYKSSFSGKTTIRLLTNSINSLSSPSAGAISVGWTQNNKASGYLVQYSLSKTFASGNQHVNISSASALTNTFTGLTRGATYYVRVRSYRTSGANTYYSGWSGVHSVTVK